MIEEVKKILEQIFVEGISRMRTYPAGTIHEAINFEELAQQICQLFPKTAENPNGYEPKPDEVDMSQVVGHGGEVDESDLTLEETEAAVLAILKPDESEGNEGN